MGKKFDVVVIGAGINGLSAAYHLSRYPKLKVGVLEQHSIGNSFGGSHGASRIIRSTYPHPAFIHMMKRVQTVEWPRLEKETNCRLIYQNPGCFYGYGTAFEKYIQAICESELDIQVLSPAEAKNLFPQFHFRHASAVLLDRTAGVIAAKDTLDSLKSIILENGVDLFENTRALKIDVSKDPIHISTEKEGFYAERLVITAGAWIEKLLPELKSIVKPIRQTVAYFKLQGERSLQQIGQFPCWSFIGEGDNELYYGLPEFGSEGVKISRHVTMGRADDPDAVGSHPEMLKVNDLEKFIREHFAYQIEKYVANETCFYANLPGEGFIIDHLPNDNRVVIGLVCSGHGFKFAPLTGLLLSELVLHGKRMTPELKMFSMALEGN